MGRQHSTQDKVLEFAPVWGNNLAYIVKHRGKWSEETIIFNFHIRY